MSALTAAEAERVAQIEARLGKITSGEWQPEGSEYQCVYTVIDGEEYTVCVTETGSGWNGDANMQNDAWFIAHAPEDIRALLQIIARLSSDAAPSAGSEG